MWFYYLREKWRQWMPRGIILIPLNLVPTFTTKLSNPNSRWSGVSRRRSVPLEMNYSQAAVFILQELSSIIVLITPCHHYPNQLQPTYNHYLFMGPSPSHFAVTQFYPQDWVVEMENGYCVLLKNVRTGQIVEEYDMLLRGDLTMQQQLEFYEYRKAQNKHLVSVVAIKKEDSAGICTGKDYYKIYTERIPFRLTEVDYLTFPEALMVIRDAIVGYDEIKESYYGLLKVTNEMIGFTPEGEVKVWINEDFQFNTPERKHIMKGYGHALPLVTQILALVQASTADRHFPQSFRAETSRLDESVTYKKVIDLIENYAMNHGIQIPHRLNIVRTERVSNKPNKAELVEVAETYNVQVNPLPISTTQRHQIINPRIPHTQVQSIYTNVPSHLPPPPTNVSVRAVPENYIVHQKAPEVKIPQRYQRVERRVVNQHNMSPRSQIPQLVPRQPQFRPQQNPKFQHTKYYSDVVPIQLPENGNVTLPFENIMIRNNARNNRFVERPEMATLAQNQFYVKSKERVHISPQTGPKTHNNPSSFLAPSKHPAALPIKPQSNFSYQTPIHINKPLLPQRNQSPLPNQPRPLQTQNSSNLPVITTPVKSKVPPDSPKRNQSFLEHDTLTQRIDMLTASIQKQLQDIQFPKDY